MKLNFKHKQGDTHSDRGNEIEWIKLLTAAQGKVLSSTFELILYKSQKVELACFGHDGQDGLTDARQGQGQVTRTQNINVVLIEKCCDYSCLVRGLHCCA